MSVTETDPPRTAPERRTLPERFDARWRPSWGVGLVAVAVLVALGVFVVWQTYPNYDTYYTLVWGQELADGHLPDYSVYRGPTPHPLATFVGLLLAPFGTDTDRIVVLLGLLAFVLFLVVMYRFTEKLLGRLVALLAVAFLLTRTDMMLLALRGMFDLPFYLLIFSAALLEIARPRRGWPVLALLALAGLLRPEAWLLAGVYWLWLAPATPRRELVWLAVLVVAPPVIWLLADWIVTGEPLYSFTSTRDLSGQFGRNRGLGDAILHVPRFAGANDSILTTGVGGLGLLVAVYILRRRAAVPLALGGLGVLTFLIIAAAGLSVIPRYMTIPSLLLTLCVPVAFVGWMFIKEPVPRMAAIGIAVVALAILGWRAPWIARDYDALRHQVTFVEAQHKSLFALLDEPGATAPLQSCLPLTTPTHSPMPIIRYKTGLGPDDVQASIAQSRPPTAGTQLIGRFYNFEPGSGRSTTVAAPRVSVRKDWSQTPAPGFEKLASTARWTLYGRCGT